ncbi:hypothetical protein V1509DRAFT_567551, partial [Lipomyces kononenkoae]
YGDGVLFCRQGSGSVPGALIYMDPKPMHALTVLNNFYGRPFMLFYLWAALCGSQTRIMLNCRRFTDFISCRIKGTDFSR